MSGTSLDGVDIICVTFSYNGIWSYEILNAETLNYSKDWKKTLSQLIGRSREELITIDNVYSDYLSSLVQGFIAKHKIVNIDFVASHGHTALHQPQNGLTLQIGNQQVFSDLLNQKVICDFRIQDVELGGQGAPLVPIGDRLLFSDYDFCLNLGGFANISFEENNNRLAFDICPVNIVLNHYVSKLGLDYDDRGQLASKGIINVELLYRLNSLEFYNEKPPKSLGLEWVDKEIFPLIDEFQLSEKAILRTFVEHVVIQILKIVKQSNSKVLVTGGGVYNEFLISRLNELSTTQIILPNRELIEFKEALIFGLLGVLKDRNEVNSLSSVTGATKDHSSGKILIPNSKN